SLQSRLLRTAVYSMAVVVSATQLLPMAVVPGILDIFRRMASLIMQTAVILLVMTFGRHGPDRLIRMRIWSMTAVVAGIEIALGAIVYTLGGGVHHDTGTWTDQVVLAFHGVHLLAFLAMACVVAGACLKTALNPHQLPTARLSMLLTLGAAISASIFVVLKFISLTSDAVFTHSLLQKEAISATISLLIMALVLGVIHPVVTTVQRTFFERLGADLVQPLWHAVTWLHPEVVLPHSGLTAQERLFRLIVETHDGLGLIRRDPDPALLPAHENYPEEPRQTAALLLHLLGEKALGPRPS